MNKCRVCSTPNRTAIDRALAAGASLRGLAAKFGASRSSLDRHRAHAPHASPTATANGSPPKPANASASVPPPASRLAPPGRARGKRGASAPVPEATAAGAKDAPVAAPAASPATGMVTELLSLVRTNLAALTADDVLTHADRAKLQAAGVQALGVLARMEGHASDLPEARVVRFPAVRRVLETVVQACGPWPEAQRAIADALRELGGGTR